MRRRRDRAVALRQAHGLCRVRLPNDRQTSYYYDRVYVDPNDDETVWMPVFELKVSRDGGRTFEEVNMRHVHNDLHSMWIDPSDSDYIVVSGDGGVSITYDGAKTWQQTVLPIGQFYETAVDNADPYHVFGGMQDTGHWRAPVRTYDEEGITAHDWIKLRYTGDHFHFRGRAKRRSATKLALASVGTVDTGRARLDRRRRR